jgi:hypothetical protein
MNHHMNYNPLWILQIDENMFHEIKETDLIDDVYKHIPAIFIVIQYGDSIEVNHDEFAQKKVHISPYSITRIIPKMNGS